MLLTPKSVELLAPAGTWDAMAAGIDAGADAVYLGGKHFNMRMHEGEFNFTDEKIKAAISYAHKHDVKLYITLNNLISDEELPVLQDYLCYLAEINPDAILVQDFAVLELVKKMNLVLNLHASVMMNIHNEHTIERLKEYGITRVVVSREMTLAELSLFRERTNIEVEYFMHGDMCIAESGQCLHSGVIFGQSGNRGRCLKTCRWAYKLIDDNTGEILDANSPGPYKLAIKDMCMYRSIPELIQAGVYSFKIEGRMRSPEFIHRLVTAYRKTIDDYIADPIGYSVDEAGWQDLYGNRVRDFTTTFALGSPTAKDIGFTGEREPRFFSKAAPEATFQGEILLTTPAINASIPKSAKLSVRVGTVTAAKQAIVSGADTVYIGGEAYLPERPLKLRDYEQLIDFAKNANPSIRIVINTPRTTMRRECGELEQFFTAINQLSTKPDGIMVSNLGSLKLAQTLTDLPLQADYSFNLFNHLAAIFLKDNGLSMVTSSFELSFSQLRAIVENSPLPIETIVHGSYESMICDHNLPAMSIPNYNELANPEIMNRRYALLDDVGEKHSIRVDQFGRSHIYFAKDLCLYPYLEKFSGISSYRLELHDYEPNSIGVIVHIYRHAIDNLIKGKDYFSQEAFGQLHHYSPRKLGIGAYRFRQSRNSI